MTMLICSFYTEATMGIADAVAQVLVKSRGRKYFVLNEFLDDPTDRAEVTKLLPRMGFHSRVIPYGSGSVIVWYPGPECVVAEAKAELMVAGL
jgi:hypothetical protein